MVYNHLLRLNFSLSYIQAISAEIPDNFRIDVTEAERESILERTNHGRIAAFAAGVKFGRN
ncbi:hypothetical protein D9562_23295 [Escherichia coli]|nr:hypothetical protein [Escherichia coli]EFF9605584.1 hypothetical protein [Escherichia coli]QKB35858.1 hypothetical protein E3156_27095 [Escherichia coli O55:H7]